MENSTHHRTGGQAASGTRDGSGLVSEIHGERSGRLFYVRFHWGTWFNKDRRARRQAVGLGLRIYP